MTNAWSETLWKTNNDLHPAIYDVCSSQLVNYVNSVTHNVETITTAITEYAVYLEIEQVLDGHKK